MKKAWIYIVAAILFVMGAVIFTVGAGLVGFDITGITTEDEFTDREYTSVGDITHLEIKDENAAVSLTTSNDGVFHVKYGENSNHTYTLAEENGVLSVKYNMPKRIMFYIFNVSFKGRSVEVQVPKDYKGSACVKTENGKITISLPSLGDTAVISENGSVSLHSVIISGNLDVNTQNGDIRLSETVISHGLAIVSENGDTHINGCETGANAAFSSENGEFRFDSFTSGGSIKIDTENGDIRFQALNFTTSFECETENGDVSGHYAEASDAYNYKIDSRESHRNLPAFGGSGSKSIVFETENGKIELYFAQ